MDLPMAMRFRKLKEHAREAVGVYRYQSNIYLHVPSTSNSSRKQFDLEICISLNLSDLIYMAEAYTVRET